jgi:hypothetical protein
MKNRRLNSNKEKDGPRIPLEEICFDVCYNMKKLSWRLPSSKMYPSQIIWLNETYDLPKSNKKSAALFAPFKALKSMPVYRLSFPLAENRIEIFSIPCAIFLLCSLSLSLL